MEKVTNAEIRKAMEDVLHELTSCYYGIGTLPADHPARIAYEQGRGVLVRLRAQGD